MTRKKEVFRFYLPEFRGGIRPEFRAVIALKYRKSLLQTEINMKIKVECEFGRYSLQVHVHH